MWDRSERSSAPIQRAFRVFFAFAAGFVGLNASLVPLEGAAGPIRVSENGRYFVDEQVVSAPREGAKLSK